MFRGHLSWAAVCLVAAAASPVFAQEPDLTYHTVAPCVVLDTRVAGGAFSANETRTYTVVGSGSLASQGGSSGGCGVPGFSNSIPQVQAVALNIVAINASTAGHLQAWAADTTTTTAVLNFTTGVNIANTTPVAVAQSSGVGDFKIKVNIASAHVQVSVVGYYSKAVQTVYVHPVPGDAGASGTQLANALAGITNASATKRYVVKVEPGIYDVGSTGLQMKDYVDIEGSGQQATVIKGTGNSNPGAAGVVKGAASAEIRDLQVVADGSEDVTIGILLPNGADTSIRDVTVAVSGTKSNWGIRNLSNTSSSIEGVTITTTGGTVGYGIGNRFVDTHPAIKRTVITVTGGSSMRYGISATSGADLPELRDVQIDVSGGSTSYGVNVDSLVGGNGLTLRITSSSIKAEDVGVFSNTEELWVEHSQVRATDTSGVGIEASTAVIDNSIIEGAGNTVIAFYAQIAATRLGGGAVSASLATCAGVSDESFTFYASTCP